MSRSEEGNTAFPALPDGPPTAQHPADGSEKRSGGGFLDASLPRGEQAYNVSGAENPAAQGGSGPPCPNVTLTEGWYFIDREPLRAFFTIDDEQATVEIIHVKGV